MEVFCGAACVIVEMNTWLVRGILIETDALENMWFVRADVCKLGQVKKIQIGEGTVKLVAIGGPPKLFILLKATKCEGQFL